MAAMSSILIVSKDRKNDLRRAIRSALAQVDCTEVLVVDDGSLDGTSDMIRSEFPNVRLVRSESSLGCVRARNLGTSLCSSNIVFSIDDDAEFSTPNVVRQTLPGFQHPRVGAVAIPYSEPNKSMEEYQRAPNELGIWVTDSFRGTAYAMRRDVFLALGGYGEHITHQGEEIDYCIRLLNGGFVVRLGYSDAILHYEAPKRDWRKMDLFGRRNDVLFAWNNVPMPYLPLHLAATTYNGVRFGLKTRRLANMITGLKRGYRDGLRGEGRVAPVSRTAYRIHRRLKSAGSTKLEEIEGLLANMSGTGA